MVEIAHVYKTNSLSIPEVIPIRQLGIGRAIFVVPNRTPFAFVAWYYNKSQQDEYLLELYGGAYFDNLDDCIEIYCRQQVLKSQK